MLELRGPELIDTGILAAINELKRGKAEGCDGIPAELLKALGERREKYLVKVCKSINETRKWPEDFTKAIIVKIDKKMNASECADHKTINLIAHASKIMLKLLGKRLEKFADDRGMVAQTEKGLQIIMDLLSKSEKEHDMKTNLKKIKVMRVNRNERKREGGKSLHNDRRTMVRTSEPVS